MQNANYENMQISITGYVNVLEKKKKKTQSFQTWIL